jgi:hypothetical protein
MVTRVLTQLFRFGLFDKTGGGMGGRPAGLAIELHWGHTVRRDY